MSYQIINFFEIKKIKIKENMAIIYLFQFIKFK